MIDTPKPEEKRKWTPEQRMVQSRTIRRLLQKRPWTPEQNAARAEALRGKRKSIEARAAMYASRVTGVAKEDATNNPEWQRLYNERLTELREEERWSRITERAKELNLEPEDVKFAVEMAFAGDAE